MIEQYMIYILSSRIIQNTYLMCNFVWVNYTEVIFFQNMCNSGFPASYPSCESQTLETGSEIYTDHVEDTQDELEPKWSSSEQGIQCDEVENVEYS
jgi:hypothetical protein